MMDKKAIPLPELSENKFEFEHFPTRMQAFIFRNWDMVPKERIALCLKTDVSNIEKQAEKMGLGPQGDVSVWLERGYISIIRSNWNLIPYSQLMTLLDFDAERLAFVLKEEDFLDIKLGWTKPDCPEIIYCELNDEQEKKTEKIKKIITESFGDLEEKFDCKPFDFFNSYYNDTKKTILSTRKGGVTVDELWCIDDRTKDENVAFMTERFIHSLSENWGVALNYGKQPCRMISIDFLEEKKEAEYHEICVSDELISIKAADSAGVQRALTFLEDLAQCAGGLSFEKKVYKRSAVFKTRFIYSFCGLYNDALDVDSSVYCPDELLEKYAKVGINGIWIQAVLYRLHEYTFNPKLSVGWEKRLDILSEFVKRAKRYGIKIYLYINEPRAMPLSFFEEYPELLGNKRDGYGCLCTSTSKIQNYLSEAIEGLCRAVPDIGGFFTITRSENITNCYSLTTEMTCPRCAKREQYEVIAEVNTIIAESAKRVNPDIRVFAWDWSWRIGEFMSPEEIKKCIELMPKDVVLQSNRETELPTYVGGIKGEVNDYSVSVCGVSPYALEEWEYAKNTGHETCAKLQINNSWECSTIPYLPVYSLLTDNVELLAKNGVNHLMLSWTLGGFPSPNIKIVSELFFKEEKEEQPDYDIVYKSLYGEYAETVRKTSKAFGDAFKEFPFHIDTLYVGPQNGGASNLMYLKPTGQKATMTCYAFDDLEHWRSIYPEDVFEKQLEKLCNLWEKGLELLADMPECEFKDISRATYIQFKASYNQVHFIRLRKRYIENENEAGRKLMTEVLRDEADISKELFAIMRRNPSIGFEAANHYYYTQGMLKEKILNCEYLMAELNKN